MSALARAAQEYLRLRRSLGHDLAEHHRLLPRFGAYLETIGAATVTIEAALAWAQQPDTDPANSVWPRRMTIARGFARHMASIDPATEIPPLGLIPSRQRWRPPYIYSPADIDALMAAAREIRRRLPAATHETLIRLLAATGMFSWGRPARRRFESLVCAARRLLEMTIASATGVVQRSSRRVTAACSWR
jgi:integrase